MTFYREKRVIVNSWVTVDRGGVFMAADSGAPGDAPGAGSSSSSFISGVEIKTRLGTDVSTGGGGRSGHDKLLDLRAERHADAARADPTDFDAHYSWALVLQEQAERAEQSGMDPNRRDAILIDACAKYAKARDLRANSISTLYNWGIALGDRARLKGDSGDAVEARAMWRQACEKYRAAVECDASRTQSTQALNNWGLALQQMATLERDPGARERRLLAAVGRFREAIRRDPGFHRAVYNLGTIMYALSERARGHGGRDPRGERSEHASSNGGTSKPEHHASDSNQTPLGSESAPTSADELQTAAAMYICCAQASGARPVYASSLRLVRHTLPLPALLAGTLTTAPPALGVATAHSWRRRWFVLDHEALWTGESWPADVGASGGGGAGGVGDAFGAVGAWNHSSTIPPWVGDATTTTNHDEQREERRARRRRRAAAADEALVARDGPWGVHVKTSDVASAQPCAESSLPSGYAFRVGMADGSSHYFLCDDDAARERWVDALTLVRHVAARGRGEALRAELTSDATVAPQLRNKGRGAADEAR